MVNLQLISLTQLALHDIRRETQGQYIFSYILSLLVTVVITLDFIRAWIIVGRKNFTVESLSEINYEHGLIKKYWTRHLDETAQQNGNTFMVRDRVRWTVF